MKSKMENAVEKFIWNSRLMVFFAVIASIISALLLIVIASYDSFIAVKDLLYSLSDKNLYKTVKLEFLANIFSALDYYLIATVLLIFGKGLYELFISKLEVAEKDRSSSKILIIKSLDDLKDKFVKLILLVLMVTFFKYAFTYRYENIESLLYLSAGIFIISMSSYFIYLTGRKEKKTTESSGQRIIEE